MRILGTQHHLDPPPPGPREEAVALTGVVIISECNLLQDNVLGVGKTG